MANAPFPLGTIYRIVPLKNMQYAVQVTKPNAGPSQVTAFATEREAEAWIAARKQETNLDRLARNPGLDRLDREMK